MNGLFNTPFGIAIDSSGNVYVADSGNNRIQKFKNDGISSENGVLKVQRTANSNFQLMWRLVLQAMCMQMIVIMIVFKFLITAYLSSGLGVQQVRLMGYYISIRYRN